jgi:hypothetical protein
VDEDNIPSAGTSETSPVTPRRERFSRRRWDSYFADVGALYLSAFVYPN